MFPAHAGMAQEARDMAQSARRLLCEKLDPIEEWRKQREIKQRQVVITFREVALAYIDEQALPGDIKERFRTGKTVWASTLFPNLAIAILPQLAGMKCLLFCVLSGMKRP